MTTSVPSTASTETRRTSVATASRPLRIGIYVLAAATALVHLYLGVVTTRLALSGDDALLADLGGATAMTVMAALFYLSFAGYVVLAVALYLPALHRWSRPARWALIVWAAGNLLAYVAMAQGHVDAFGVADKACEIALIALLVVEGRRPRPASQPGEAG